MQLQIFLITNPFHLFTFSIFIIIILFPLISITQCLEENSITCAPQSCGNLSNIRYPFWVPTKQESYCGHPSFSLCCINNTTPIFTISNDNYVVTSIDYLNHNFHLVNSLVYDNSTHCPTPLLNNITLKYTPFSFSTNNYADFYLFYNCTNLPKEYYVYFPINCNNKGDFKSFGDFHYEDLVQLNYSLGLCKSIVTVPIDIDMDMKGIPGSESYFNMSYWEILSQGITMSWNLKDDCNLCAKSGGRCEFIDNQFVCLCKDNTPSTSCYYGNSTTPKINNRVKVISLGIGIAVCLLIGTLFILFLRIRKKSFSKQFITNKTSYSSSGGSTFPFLNGSTYFGVQVFNYRELEEATDYFNPLKELGEGGFGTVYHGKLPDGREVAIKRLYENNSKRAEQFLNEVEILANLRHKNLVNLYGCTARQSRELLLVYEYVPNGTVADHLHGKQSKVKPLPWSTRLKIATQTSSALVYLHESDIIHRDVKTQNILLGNDFSVKVADFGLSRLFPLDVTHVSTAPQGTPGYVDPEYFQCYQLTEKSDVYSFGVLLAEIISSLPAVDITRKRTEINLSNMAINKIQDGNLHEFVDTSLGFESDFTVKKEITEVAELAFQCLQSTKEMRPFMKDVYKRLLAIKDQKGSEINSADILDIPVDDVLMLKGDFSPPSPPREEYTGIRYNYKANASV